MKRLQTIYIWLIVLLALGGCGSIAVPNRGDLGFSTAEATSLGEAASTALSTPSPVIVGGTAEQRFLIDERATSTDDVLSRVALELRQARVTGDELVLRVAFVNTSDQSFSVVGSLSGAAARLEDASGEEAAPRAVEPALNSISPDGGFVPGAANVGDITFPLLSSNQPYVLHFPSYEPISFQLDTPLPATPDVVLNNGRYPLDTALRSQREALRPIELRLQSLDVRADALVFEVAFANVGRQGYDLLTGPSGQDARLIDGEGRLYAPVEVADSLETSIAPEGGWQAQQEHSGTITFPRPQALESLRFTFPEYDALTIAFDTQGLASTTVTSASGGPPAPTPTPTSEEALLSVVDALLAQQARAVETGDVEVFARTFVPELQDEQRAVFQRLAEMPLLSYTLRLDSAALGSSDLLTGVPIELTYTLRGIDPANVFQHDLRYSLLRAGDEWRVTGLTADDTPPFWWVGNVVTRETAHFLIVARPEMEGELPALEQETEQAYADLQARGLPLEPRYVAYFTATQEDFTSMTGQAARYLGVALSRYRFQGDTISTVGQAFYINGASFSQQGSQFGPATRLTTITHELVHLALAADTRPFTPAWLVEGVAVYFSEDTGGAFREQLLAGNRLDTLSLPALTRVSSLGEHDSTGDQVGYEYSYSGAAVAYLVEQYGEASVLDFYRSYAAVPVGDIAEQLPRTGGATPDASAFANLSVELTERAVPQFFDVSLDQLDTDVKAWLMP